MSRISASPSESQKGLALVPEDRQRDGLVQTMTVGQNLSLATIGAFVEGLLVSAAANRIWSTGSIQKVHIKTVGRKRRDRLAVRRQSAESRHRQNADDQSQGHSSR